MPQAAPQVVPQPSAQYPTAAGSQLPVPTTPAGPPAVGPPALIAVQCPVGTAAGVTCYQQASTTQQAPAAAGLVPAAPIAAPSPVPLTAPTVPVAPTVPAPCTPSHSSTGSGDDDDQSGSGADSSQGSGKSGHHGGHSKKGHDSAAVLPDSTAGQASGCGLIGQASAATGGVTSAATGDLSSLEAQSGKQIELTGYSYQDNQGGNNATISCPQIHKTAGGTGTYADPITVASGGSNGGASADGVKCGDRFYLPSVQRYVIVEDTGNTPDKARIHLDMYVGDDPGKSCMNKITGTVPAIPNPPAGLPVLAGPIGSNGGCLLPGSASGAAGGSS